MISGAKLMKSWEEINEGVRGRVHLGRMSGTVPEIGRERKDVNTKIHGERKEYLWDIMSNDFDLSKTQGEVTAKTKKSLDWAWSLRLMDCSGSMKR